MQTDLFIHGVENNRESDMFYEANLKHFSKQAKKVLGLLMSGQELTSMKAMVEHNIVHLARRKKDLSDAGVLISERWENNCKVWFLTNEQKQFNKKFLNQ